MSVLIKTMEMPKNCGECQFCHTENFKQWCCPTGREDIFYDAKPEWCPLEKPKSGEWLVHDIVCREEMCLPYECPNCGFRYGGRFNFCPNCGADMRGEDE